MKILKDNEHAALQAKADNYDMIVNAVLNDNPNLTADDVTPETIQEVIHSANEPDATLQTQLDAANTALETANNRITELDTENANLRESAGGESSVVKTKTEVTGEEKTLADFAKENAGDTEAILAEAKKSGLI